MRVIVQYLLRRVLCRQDSLMLQESSRVLVTIDAIPD
jgi:hypothetical protein